MATVVNFTVDQGTDFVRTLVFLSGTTPVDLTGYTFQGQARTAYGVATVSFSFTFTLKDQITDTGKVDMAILNTATTNLKLKATEQYVYDIERESPDGIIERIMEGTITLKPEVTK